MKKISRKQLKKIGRAERHTFIGCFGRTGFKTARKGIKEYVTPTLLLRNVAIVLPNGDKQPVTDHLWFNYGKQFINLGMLHVGDLVQFDARVDDYYKGYFDESKRKDYKLSRPTKVKLLTSREKENIPGTYYGLEYPQFEGLEAKHALIGMILKENQKFYHSNFRGTEDDTFYLNAFKKWCELNSVDYDSYTNRLSQEKDRINKRVNDFFDILESEHSRISSRISGKCLLISGHGGKEPTEQEMSKATGLSVKVVKNIRAGIHDNDDDYKTLENHIDKCLKKAKEGGVKAHE